MDILKSLGHPEEILNLFKFKMGGCTAVMPKLDYVSNSGCLFVCCFLLLFFCNRSRAMTMTLQLHLHFSLDGAAVWVTKSCKGNDRHVSLRYHRPR